MDGLNSSDRFAGLDWGRIATQLDAEGHCLLPRLLNADESQVAFNGQVGRESIAQMGRMVQNGTMQNLTYADAQQLFVNGKLAVLSTSTSRLASIEKQIGDKFRMKTGFFPVYSEAGKVPAGGNVAMMFAQDPERQKAAWEYIKFATGPQGAVIMTQATGYFPESHRIVKSGATE